jgi:hypothetical protein
MKRIVNTDETKTPTDILIEIINIQKKKEEKINIWENSVFKDIATLEANNVGNVGEMYTQKICEICKINSDINGLKTKQICGGLDGDGTIKYKTVEIKTARLGASASSFQHELGEHPWNADYMIFVDISPKIVFITIFKNFTEKQYKEKGFKCKPFFPTKTITRRKGEGNFKLDTTFVINKKNIATGYALIITDQKWEIISSFINKNIV